MNIQENPTEHAYQLGYESYTTGCPKTDNPYPETSDHYNHWLFGYDMAKSDRQEYLESIDPLRPEDYL